VTSDLKKALEDSAAIVGMPKWVSKLDENGKETGNGEFVPSGEGGLTGYLTWAALKKSEAYLGLWGRLLPMQVNAKIQQKPPRVEYRTVDEIKTALRAKGIDPDVIERSMMPKFLQEQRKEEEVRAALRERGIDPDILEAPPDVLAAIGLKFLEDKKPDPVQ
jgi:hypothetical protein